MYRSNNMLSAPFSSNIRIDAATDMTKSLKPKKRQGKLFTQFNNTLGLNSMKQGKKTLIGY
tara:strand:- start:1369 stop:1551 length:183 start_codon:yes stop_codon:yes gene_type:complete